MVSPTVVLTIESDGVMVYVAYDFHVGIWQHLRPQSRPDFSGNTVEGLLQIRHRACSGMFLSLCFSMRILRVKMGSMVRYRILAGNHTRNLTLYSPVKS